MTSSTSTAYLYEADAVPAGPPPPSQLRWKDAPPEKLAFMQDVYRRHVAAVAKSGRRFVASIPRSELGEIERGIFMKGGAAAAEVRSSYSTRPARTGRRIALRGSQGPPAGPTGAEQQRLPFARAAIRALAEILPEVLQGDRRTPAPDPAGEHGSAAADRLARYVRKWVGAPGYSLHQDGRAMDLEGGSLGPTGSAASRQAWGQSWYWDWLVRNAARYHFQQNTSINEPWHWQYFGGGAAGPPALPGQPATIRPATVRPGTVRPVSSPRNFLIVDQVPVLAGHRGRPLALVIGWNAGRPADQDSRHRCPLPRLLAEQGRQHAAAGRYAAGFGAGLLRSRRLRCAGQDQSDDLRDAARKPRWRDEVLLPGHGAAGYRAPARGSCPRPGARPFRRPRPATLPGRSLLLTLHVPLACWPPWHITIPTMSMSSTGCMSRPISLIRWGLRESDANRLPALGPRPHSG